MRRSHETFGLYTAVAIWLLITAYCGTRETNYLWDLWVLLNGWAIAVWVFQGWFGRDARQRRRAVSASRGMCAQCGYDLRASDERCPECGTPLAATPARIHALEELVATIPRRVPEEFPIDDEELPGEPEEGEALTETIPSTLTPPPRG